MRKQWFIFALAILLVAGSASAQNKEWYGFLTGSWVMPMGETGDNLDDDFTVSISVWPEGIPEWTLGSGRFTGLATSTGIRP